MPHNKKLQARTTKDLYRQIKALSDQGYKFKMRCVRTNGQWTATICSILRQAETAAA